MKFKSQAQRRAAFASMAHGGDALNHRRYGEVWGKRGIGSKLVPTAAGTRDRALMARAAARVPEAEQALVRFERSQEHTATRRREAGRALMRGFGVGTGIAALGAGVALGVSPRLQVALGRQLLHVRRILPVRTTRGAIRGFGRRYTDLRKAGVEAAAEKAASGVRWLDKKLIGDLPDLPEPPFAMVPLGRKVRIRPSIRSSYYRRRRGQLTPLTQRLEGMKLQAEAIFDRVRSNQISPEKAMKELEAKGLLETMRASVVDRGPSQGSQKTIMQNWMAHEAAAEGRDSVRVKNLVDRLDEALKRGIARGIPHPGDAVRRLFGLNVKRPRRLFRLDIDPQWVSKYQKDVARWEKEAQRAGARHGYARVRDLE